MYYSWASLDISCLESQLCGRGRDTHTDCGTRYAPCIHRCFQGLQFLNMFCLKITAWPLKGFATAIAINSRSVYTFLLRSFQISKNIFLHGPPSKFSTFLAAIWWQDQWLHKTKQFSDLTRHNVGIFNCKFGSLQYISMEETRWLFHNKLKNQLTCVGF